MVDDWTLTLLSRDTESLNFKSVQPSDDVIDTRKRKDK